MYKSLLALSTLLAVVSPALADAKRSLIPGSPVEAPVAADPMLPFYTPTLTLDDLATPAPALPASTRMPSYELPAVKVEGSAPALFEEERVGTYGQPRWTATRRFPTTRVYVIPEGHIEVEYWLRPTFNRDGTTDLRSLYEVEIGLPYHLQIDLYFRTDYNSQEKELLSGGQFEVRWALADWGVIPGNPTFYMEYLQLEDRPSRIEPKLLLGGEIAPRWHWGLNIVWEQEIGRASRGEGEHELEFDGGISYSVIDSYLSVGVETLLNFNNTRENRSAWNTELYIGPSIQWRPIKPLSINFTPMAGVTNDSGDARLYLNVGWEF